MKSKAGEIKQQPRPDVGELSTRLANLNHHYITTALKIVDGKRAPLDSIDLAAL